MSNSLKLAPYHPITGALLHYDGKSYRTGPWNDPNTQMLKTNYRPNDPFWATLHLERMETGRSSKIIIWRDEARDTVFPMFIRDFLDLAKHDRIELGVARGQWWVRKAGANYGLARYTP